MINGLFVGMGAAVGTWFVTRHFIKPIENLTSRKKEHEEPN
jgi:hypothetical protein